MGVSTWALAARPKTWIASISPVLIGTSCALKEQRIDWILFFFTLITALGIQITTNFANDYFDFIKGADTKNRKGPLRVTQAGLVSLSQMRQLIIGALLVTMCTGLVLTLHGGWMIGALLAISLLLAIGYTGGPFPLAYLGLGEVFVLLFFGIAAGLGTYYLQTGEVSKEILIASIGPGALSTALLILNNLRDVEEDRMAGKRTLVVRFGTLFGEIEYHFMLLLSLAPIAYFIPNNPAMGLTCASFLLLLRSSNRFASLGKLLWFYTLLFCILR